MQTIRIWIYKINRFLFVTSTPFLAKSRHRAINGPSHQGRQNHNPIIHSPILPFKIVHHHFSKAYFTHSPTKTTFICIRVIFVASLVVFHKFQLTNRATLSAQKTPRDGPNALLGKYCLCLLRLMQGQRLYQRQPRLPRNVFYIASIARRRAALPKNQPNWGV
ncbi:MAG: hypothetical protein ACRCZA_11750 [Shewanella sp.]|uniref:hypothetical protein n=1 Tax=Shewanella sp. TaxID=50422 RepID=UPI003F2A0ECE